jgi:cytochrome c5
MFEEWDGDLLVGALKGKHISKLDLDGDVVRSSQPMLKEIKGRVRDIKVAADGSIHVLSENGTLYRLYREPAPESVERPVRSALIYDMVCSGCHDTGADSAPVLGHPDQWKEILAQPRELTYERTIEGYEAMPERGLCGICTDRHLKATVDYMLDQALIQQAKD